ncbi:DNA double-strand break repair nuclease NurA [Candidatus Babeliales bacterium]|nr:DNA double-strand break repair nuclease NurA [Candidatus Babeliales bacterium]
MLHKAKVLKALEDLEDSLFVDTTQELDSAYKAWKQLICDDTFKEKIEACDVDWPLPTWEGNLDDVFPVQSYTDPYQLLAVDGSQIYPDKHQGTSCFLINVGTVELQYGTGLKGATLDATPHVFSERMHFSDDGFAGSTDLVNCKREELELEYGYNHIIKMEQEGLKDPLVFLFDGSLIFWHLESKEENLKHYFLKKYCDQLKLFKKQKTIMGGYISLPKSKELVNIVRMFLLQFSTKKNPLELLPLLVDTAIVNFFLPPGARTTLFKNRSTISDYYPESVRPYFFYINVSDEIARVEIPAYLAEDKSAVDLLSAIVLDQSQKGGGYPVGIAEAHEQAVVKGPDREFFYHLIEKCGIKQKRRIMLSQKSRKKRGIAV